MDYKHLSTTNLYTDKDKQFLDAFKEDPQLARFLSEWIRNGGNSTKAYLKIHPDVKPASARVLGARQLAKVNVRDLLATIGLDNAQYAHMLYQGLHATKAVGQYELPDYATRFKYFMVLGRLLGIDNGPSGPTAVFNNMNAVIGSREK